MLFSLYTYVAFLRIFSLPGPIEIRFCDDSNAKAFYGKKWMSFWTYFGCETLILGRDIRLPAIL